jgi:protein-L-isoaspartate(D-aspartate) O-methyltransferase
VSPSALRAYGTGRERRHRESLVRQLQASGAIRSSAVRDAFLAIPRETFVPVVLHDHGIAAVYRDEAFPTKLDDRGDAVSSSSQPGIMAAMLEELRVSPGQRVLEIGTGTGYNAALLSFLVGPRGQVTSVELDPGVAKDARRAVRDVGARARVVVGDGRRGWQRGAPYDRVILTASSLDVPRAFLDQLTEGGLLVLPLRLSDAVPFRQIVVTFKRLGPGLTSVSVMAGGFMRLRARVDDPSLPWSVNEVVETHDGGEACARLAFRLDIGSALGTGASRTPLVDAFGAAVAIDRSAGARTSAVGARSLHRPRRAGGASRRLRP